MTVKPACPHNTGLRTWLMRLPRRVMTRRVMMIMATGRILPLGMMGGKTVRKEMVPVEAKVRVVATVLRLNSRRPLAVILLLGTLLKPWSRLVEVMLLQSMMCWPGVLRRCGKLCSGILAVNHYLMLLAPGQVHLQLI